MRRAKYVLRQVTLVLDYIINRRDWCVQYCTVKRGVEVWACSEGQRSETATTVYVLQYACRTTYFKELLRKKKENRPPVCVCVWSSHLFCVRLVGAPAGVTQEENHTGFLHLSSAVLALIFIARRIQPSLSLVDRGIEFCVPTNYSVIPYKVLVTQYYIHLLCTTIVLIDCSASAKRGILTDEVMD